MRGIEEGGSNCGESSGEGAMGIHCGRSVELLHDTHCPFLHLSTLSLFSPVLAASSGRERLVYDVDYVSSRCVRTYA